MITVSWQKEGFEETRSNLASSIQIIEKLGEDTVAEISKSRDYKITGAAVKQFYGRLNSILSKVNFRKLEELTG
jgi:GTP1/Obg family GTP-binding protein